MRYEWKLDGVVIGEEADFDIDTYELMEKIGMTQFSKSGTNGTLVLSKRNPGLLIWFGLISR